MQWGRGMTGNGRDKQGRGKGLDATGLRPVRRSVALPFPPGPLSLSSVPVRRGPSPTFFFSRVQAKIEQGSKHFVTDLVFGEPSRRSRQSNNWDHHARALRTEFSGVTVNHHCQTRWHHENTSCVTARSRQLSSLPQLGTQNHW